MPIGRSIAIGLLVLGTSCHAQYERLTTDSGGRGYYITCANTFDGCESQANELCDGSYHRLESRHRSKNDEREMMIRARTEYNLVVECD